MYATDQSFHLKNSAQVSTTQPTKNTLKIKYFVNRLLQTKKYRRRKDDLTFKDLGYIHAFALSGHKLVLYH